MKCGKSGVIPARFFGLQSRKNSAPIHAHAAIVAGVMFGSGLAADLSWTLRIAPIAATMMSATITPYSMAVTPLSQRMPRFTISNMIAPKADWLRRSCSLLTAKAHLAEPVQLVANR